MIQAPGFWWRPAEAPGPLARALAPAAWVWGIGAWARQRLGRPERAGLPVVAVGNLTAGGAGKTPMAMALVERLAARGVAAAVVSRGHGGRLAGPVLVEPARHSAADVGDEPLLLAQSGPVIVARDRPAGAALARAAGAGAIVLDDGFQDPSLAKDLSIVMVDAGQGFGNGRLIPAGPLREPVAAGLARADLVVLVGPAETRAAALARWPDLAAARPLAAELRPLATGLPLRGERVLAFAGIGRPEKFFATLRTLGADLVGVEPFADHAPFAPTVLARLKERAARTGAMLVTTEKDAIRLPMAFRREVTVLPVRLWLEDWGPVDRRLDAFVSKPS